MNAHDIETLIAQALNLHAEALNSDDCTDVPDGVEEVAGILTFEEAGVLTRDAGLVIRTRDGSSFQITVVQSR
ncbi:MAG TPA: hypothetical protein PKG77_26075 [Phycisphaerae bacterium]|nr:hypothetical protein [Phycisphaerae bacterium]HQL76478.1 hypothetical protein [Phycisphaerae bacterium]